MEIKNKIVGQQILLLLDELDITQYDLADVARVDQSTISRYIKGDIYPSKRVLKLITDYYKVNQHWLLTGEGPIFVDNFNKIVVKLIEEAKTLNEKEAGLVLDYLYKIKKGKTRL